MLTNSTPIVAYFSRSDTCAPKMRSRSISAASVMAAGSVMKEPSSGMNDSARKYTASWRGTGSSVASPSTSRVDSCKIGLLPAITMIAKTNNGSVKFRLST